jgi:hypothetical protein
MVDRRANPDDPSPSLHPHYRASPLLRDGPPLCPASLLSPSRFQPLGVLAANGRRDPRSSEPTAAAGRQVHTFRAGARTTLAPPPCRTPPGQSTGTRQAHPGAPKHPRFRCHLSLSTRLQWFACARLRDPHLPRSGATSPTTLTTTALDRGSSGWFAASACTATAEGRQASTPGSSISCTAPHPVIRSSTSSLLQRSCSHPRTSSRRPSGSRTRSRSRAEPGVARVRRQPAGAEPAAPSEVDRRGCQAPARARVG